MSAAKPDAPSALVSVIKALEPLTDVDRQWVLQAASSRWNLKLPAASGGAAANASSEALRSATQTQTPLEGKVREFIRAKKPTSDVQRVACLIYFLAKTTNKEGFISKEINQAHIDSGGSKINLPRALDNATRRSKFISNRGGKEKQLTPLGEDIVDALPDQQKVSDLIKEAGKRGSRKKRAKKKQ